jgi:putative Ca2+/H+ antiporter (TMEM165/GDT1 family)
MATLQLEVQRLAMDDTDHSHPQLCASGAALCLVPVAALLDEEQRLTFIKGVLLMLTLWPIFVTVFFAELGDKTQLATLLFAADQHVSKLGVFAASSAALVLSSLLAVLVGAQLSLYVSPRVLKLVAGVGFVAIGIWVLLDARAS